MAIDKASAQGKAKFWVEIPNEMFGGDDRITPDELYLLYCLHTLRLDSDRTKVFTSVDLLGHVVKFSNNVRANENKNKIKKLLLSLVKKGFMALSAADFQYNEPLHIYLSPLAKRRNYTVVPLDIFTMTTKPDEFMVLVVIKRYEGLKDYQIPYSVFAMICGRSEKHIKTVIARMEQGGLISVDHGKYYLTEEHQVRQQGNRYGIHSDPVPEPAQASHNKIDEADQAASDNWDNWNAKLTDDDFVWYLTTTDADRKARADKRIALISKNPQGQSVVAKLMAQAQDMIKRKEQQADRERYDQFLDGSDEWDPHAVIVHVLKEDVERLQAENRLGEYISEKGAEIRQQRQDWLAQLDSQMD